MTDPDRAPGPVPEGDPDETTTSEVVVCTAVTPCHRYSTEGPFTPGRDCRRCWQAYHVPGVVNFGKEPAREPPPHAAGPAPVRPPEPPPPSDGPGTRLKALLGELGIRADGCGGCRDMAHRMDRWGVEGCRNGANRALALTHLRLKVRQSSAWSKLRAVAGAVVHGHSWIDPRDPAASLYDEAVRRAEAARWAKSDGPPAESPEGGGGNSDAELRRADDRGGPDRGPGIGTGGQVPPVPVRQPDGGPPGVQLQEGGPGGSPPGVPRPEPDGGDVPELRAPVEPVTTPEPPRAVRETRPIKWAVAVTTVPLRRADLTPRTIASLAAGGFGGEHRPWLYVDGCDDLQGWRREYRADDRDGLVRGVTCRYPLVRAYASWVLALAETFYREPTADRYAIFQDDVEVLPNLRTYLETVPLREKTYWNLWLGPWNEEARSFSGRSRPVWMDDRSFVGFAPGDLGGRGAMGLVFARETVVELLGTTYLPGRPAHRVGDRWELHPRGFRYIDGGVVEALKQLGYVELIHHPSLVRHVGELSTVEKRPNITWHDPKMPRKRWERHYEGRTFPGTDHDAIGLIDRRREP